MMEDVQGWKRKRKRLWLALALLVALLAVVVMPPLVSIGRYKSRITHLMSESLGRPVRLSSVELRLLPVPGFVLSDLTVEEDPAYGSEPVLRANTVTASIRLQSLWKGLLEISSISMDEASLNVVRTAEGRWNLDPLFRTAAAKSQPASKGPGASGQTSALQGRSQRATPLPYIQATNSRINFKRGDEKLAFSLVGTDLSFWQESPGDWRIRLRGQPARTDLTLDLPDTGVVRLEARAQQAYELRQMPVHLDLDWQEAQLGQLTKLIIGSDPGWRGDLTGELHLDGTADAAEIKTRLRATGVHRAEFAPAAPMDFDASCGFLYHFSKRALENLLCESPLGDGRIRFSGDLPGNGVSPRLSVELDRIPVAAGLDALRTVRSDFGPGLEAEGSVSGKISYAAPAPETASPKSGPSGKSRDRARSAKPRAAPSGPLAGSFTVDGFQLSGDGLVAPIQTSRIVLEPAAAAPQQSQLLGHFPANSQATALETTVAISAGGSSPLSVTARLALSGYQVTVHGSASIARTRELAHVAGLVDGIALDALAGEPVTIELAANGPWLPTQNAPFTDSPPAGADATSPRSGAGPAAEVAGRPMTDSLSGTVTLHDANWKADYLANHVEIAQATLHVGDAETRWDPVIFSYGPVKGTASLNVPRTCFQSQPCVPKFQVKFADLDASALQAAILGAREPGTLLSTLIARLRPSNPSTDPTWPTLQGTVKAESLLLGPVTLVDATATLRILGSGAEITGLDANLLGGHVHGGGTLSNAGPGQAKPSYTLEGHFAKLSPAAVGQLLELDWSGRTFNGNGKINLSGFTDKELAASVKGTLHFDWPHGSVSDPSSSSDVPAALTRFDLWTADADIANGLITLRDSLVKQGSRKMTLPALVTLENPPKVSFPVARETQANR